MTVAAHIQIRGVVQGVGFRPWVYVLAREIGLTGRVGNDAAGVFIDAFASSAHELDAFLARLRAEAPAAARIERLSCVAVDGAAPPTSFEIVRSSRGGERRPSIPADLAICDACAREIDDPRDRRYRYAFTSCTRCGPRFTIAEDIPYDRATTTMACFPMCEACRREYDDPTDRRFHAQPNACPTCGPTLRLLDARGAAIAASDPIAQAAALLAGGAIVAVKGLGGYHLACDAENEQAVRTLRERKRREEKPFAVMIADSAAAASLVAIGEAERALLAGPARPIVLLPRRDASIAPSVAPACRRLGVMLAYTPLHHVLLRDVARPLVMTSGNASDEPIACDDADALARLGSIADAFLVHDRAIASRADDSVAIVAAGAPVLVRRSRGFVPGRITLPRPLARPVLACGAQLKNTFCIGSGDGATFGPHIGDLDDASAYDGYERAIDRLERFLRVRPELLAHDMHPDYQSTRYAIARGLERVAVQHHHAHVASAMIEHGLEGPVVGVAFDGTGWGSDGTSWGGEILVCGLDGFERAASLRCLALPGGDRAIAEPWRVALAMLDDAFDGDPPLDRLALFDDLSAHDRGVVRRMIATGIGAPRASGAGRYFDAFAAIGLARPRARFEGQLAMAWEETADASEARSYPFELARDAASLVRIDLRRAVRAAVSDLLAGRGPGVVAARFHETLAAAATEAVVATSRAMPVVLTGGCFQNARLTERTLASLRAAGLAVHVHREVPPGDGGIALGQLAVADAIATARGAPSCA